MTIWISTGDRPSNSAKELSKQPGFKRLRTGKFYKAQDFIVNWGSTMGLDLIYKNDHMINDHISVAGATHKLLAFKVMTNQGVNVVPWVSSKDEAEVWSAEGHVVVARTKLTGHSGDGIIIIEKGEPIVDAPLYTKYIFKTKEFRVHATTAAVFDTQQKVRDPEMVPKTWRVRSHENGFIFQRGGIEPSDARDLLATSAIKALGLDFGAVDIIEDKKGNLYVLEINTAPGLEGQTIESYTTILRGLAQNVA